MRQIVELGSLRVITSKLRTLRLLKGTPCSLHILGSRCGLRLGR
jgi:hypothetical protein